MYMSGGDDSPQANEKTWIQSKHIKLGCVVSQKTSAEGKYTLGLQPPLGKDQLGAYKGNVAFNVYYVASALQTSDYFLSLSQKPPGTAKGCERSVLNGKDNVIENASGG